MRLLRFARNDTSIEFFFQKLQNFISLCLSAFVVKKKLGFVCVFAVFLKILWTGETPVLPKQKNFRFSLRLCGEIF
jgi:hypothetical protein